MGSVNRVIDPSAKGLPSRAWREMGECLQPWKYLKRIVNGHGMVVDSYGYENLLFTKAKFLKEGLTWSVRPLGWKIDIEGIFHGDGFPPSLFLFQQLWQAQQQWFILVFGKHLEDRMFTRTSLQQVVQFSMSSSNVRWSTWQARVLPVLPLRGLYGKGYTELPHFIKRTQQ